MIKFRLSYHKDGDIAWLNRLADNGFAMTGFFAGFWHFDPCTPGEYEYQIDLCDRFMGISNDYLDLMRDMNIEYMGKFGFWIFLRRKKTNEPFILYSDVESKLAHYQKIRRLFKTAVIIELLCFLMEVFAAAGGVQPAYYLIPAFLIIILAMMHTLVRTNEIISALKEQNGEPPSSPRRGPDPLLLAGLLANSAALLIKHAFPHPVGLIMQIAAIVLMLIGVYRSRSIFNSGND